MGQPRQIVVHDPDVIASFAAQTLVVIPAHNEEASVGGVVQRLRARGLSRIRVVDNASDDATAERARQAGAEVIRHPKAGYGLACWMGAQNLPPEVSWILYCNADASDDLDALERFAELAPEHDLILGARTHPADRRAMTLPQRFGNWLAPTLLAIFWGRRFSDLGPQRAIRAQSLEGLKMEDRGFGWTVEMQVRAVEEGLRIVEIPVRSNLRGSVAAGVIILRTLGVLAWRKAFFRGVRRPSHSLSAVVE
jgi:glycosyltransferase involved in cell wall biosynthesis